MKACQSGESYGTNITRERPNDGGSASGDPTYLTDLIARKVAGPELSTLSDSDITLASVHAGEIVRSNKIEVAKRDVADLGVGIAQQIHQGS